jgi:hypothetical protein
VTRLNRCTPAAIPRPIQRKALKLLALAAFAGAFFVIPGPCSSFASSWTKIPWTQPKIPASQISCYHRKTHRFTEERHPDRCEIAGYEGKQRRFVVLPIENLNWGHWGAGRTRAPQATEIGTGRAVRVIAWRRIRCAEETWYSATLVLDLRNGHYVVIRPPFCGRKLVRA